MLRLLETPEDIPAAAGRGAPRESCYRMLKGPEGHQPAANRGVVGAIPRVSPRRSNGLRPQTTAQAAGASRISPPQAKHEHLVLPRAFSAPVHRDEPAAVPEAAAPPRKGAPAPHQRGARRPPRPATGVGYESPSQFQPGVQPALRGASGPPTGAGLRRSAK